MPAQAWEPRTWHRYQYAYASPISYYDPYGMAVTPWDGGGGIPTGAKCSIEPWPPLLRGYQFLRAGNLQGGVFVGEPPWTVPEESPDTTVASGWLGWLELLFDLFFTYVEPWARAQYISSQPPNVVAELIYHEYEEGLQPAGLILENRSGEQVSAQWVVIIPERGKEFEGAWVTLGTESFESTKWMEIQLPPEWELIPPSYSVEVEVWFKAPVSLPLANISFTLPPRGSGTEP